MDLSHCMREVQGTLRVLLQGQLTITPPLPTQPPPPPPPPSSAASYPAISYPYGMPTAALPSSLSSVSLPSTYVPIQQIRFPPSPSQIPAWALSPTTAPIYSTTTPQASIPPALTTGAVVAHGGPFTIGTLYGGVDGTLIHGSSLLPHSIASPTIDSFPAGGNQGGEQEGVTMGATPPPKFYKLEFSTYDCSKDSLSGTIK
ncbi:uncharacterized protein [Miscanthus floridulus]|uniref:uncharacterized protein n=1 Tax=Miscanthus floridulus TaxID=154761 RepID=UPI00345B2D15